MPFSLPLRFSIPITILLVAAVIIPCSLFFTAPFIERQHQQMLKDEALEVADRLINTTVYLLARGDSIGVEREFRQNAKSEQILKVQLISPSGRILFSAQESDVGHLVSEMKSIHVDKALIEKARKNNSISHFYNTAEDALYTLAAIDIPSLDASETRADVTGVLLLELSSLRMKQATREQIQILLAALVFAMLLLAAILLFAMNKMVTSRVDKLVHASHSFAKGQTKAFAGWKGGDELSELGQAFGRMAKQITAIHAQLSSNAELLDELLENSPSMIVIRDIEGRYLRANPAYLKFAGFNAAEELLGKKTEEVLPEILAQAASEGDEQVLKTAEHCSWERTHEYDGQSKSLYSERFPLFDEAGELYAVCTIATDMTERAEREKALRLARYVFETTNDGIIVTDQNNVIVEANPAFERVTGYSQNEVLGKPPSILNSHKQAPSFYEAMWESLEKFGVWSGEIWNRKKDGQVYPEWLTVKSILDDQDEITGYFGVFTDISEQKKTEDSLRNLAYYDSLTNLANRTLCKERLSHDMELSDRHEESLAVVFIDLDFFKHVNDSLGHEYGDQLLVEAAERIQNQVRSSDTVVRWGGDEFILILPGIYHSNMALVIATNVLESLKESFHLKNTDIYIGASIGVAMYPEDAETAEALIKHADAAMYNAKSKGRDQICFFDPELNERNLALIQVKADMRYAIDRDEFELHYQPKVCLESGRIIGMEALLRWHDAEGVPVSPAEFIPVAENSGLIIPLGNWVMSSVCQCAERWRQSGILASGQRISINLSPKQLVYPELLTKMDEQFSRYPGIENFLSVEITETAAIENIQKILPVLEKIRAQGVQIELDDFGSGYSSLNYLRRLPVDILKVDKSFTDELGQNKAEQAIMESIIKMAHTLGITVVAEGVESENQLLILQALDCDKAQGFYFSKPVPVREAELLLRGDFSFG